MLRLKVFFKCPVIIIAFFVLNVIASCNNKQTAPGPVASENKDTAKSAVYKNDSLFKKYHLDKIKLPAGFKIDVFAEVENARSLTVSPSGTIFVGTKGDKVYAVTNKNGVKVFKIADGLHAPNGVAFKDGSLFIGATSTIYRMDNIESTLADPGKPVVVYDKFPSDDHHGLRFIAFGPDGKLYVPVGAPCNICDPKLPYASITRMNADGSGYEVFARGVRNTVGFDWDPESKQIWFTDNGRDNLGDNIPNDELNTASKAGLHFGYPYCHQGNILDEEFGKGKDCAAYTAPQALLGPHVASLGMRFNNGKMFPEAYNCAIFIAEHGSWNRSTPIGYRIAVVKIDEQGKAKAPEVFAEGWLQNVRDVNGRPADVQFLEDGSLLVSDDYSGVIYRISYSK